MQGDAKPLREAITGALNQLHGLRVAEAREPLNGQRRQGIAMLKQRGVDCICRLTPHRIRRLSSGPKPRPRRSSGHLAQAERAVARLKLPDRS